MSFSKICTAVFGVYVWLGYADVRRSTDIAIPIAAFARVLWQLGMTATLQRTSFSAHVLADLNRTGSAAGPMDLAGLEEPLGVVDLHLHLCRTSDRLHCLGSVFPWGRTTDVFWVTEHGSVPNSLRHRPADCPATARKRCGLVLQWETKECPAKRDCDSKPQSRVGFSSADFRSGVSSQTLNSAYPAGIFSSATE